MAEQTEQAPDAGRTGERPKGKFTPVEFGGQGGEYFSIWIVNLLLSILTLGIYSAWAKVRTHRYFYGHTLAGGHPLRYLANPVQILIGRIIGLALFVSYLLAVNLLSPMMSALVVTAILLISPYLACLSLSFNMRMTAWRNVRFGFTGRYGGAFAAFLLYPSLAALTLFIAMPWALKKMDEFIYGNLRYGDRPLDCRIEASLYFAAAFLAIIVGLALVVWIVSLGAAAGAAEAAGQAPPPAPSFHLPLVFALAYFFALAFYTARVRNHLYRSTYLPGLADFDSKVGALGLFWLWMGNLALLVLTLGLGLAWVRVRTARYFAKATSVRVGAGMDEVIAQMPEEASAIGEEVAGIFDVDVGLT